MKKTSDYAWPPNFESLHLIETETGFICYLHHGHQTEQEIDSVLQMFMKTLKVNYLSLSNTHG